MMLRVAEIAPRRHVRRIRSQWGGVDKGNVSLQQDGGTSVLERCRGTGATPSLLRPRMLRQGGGTTRGHRPPRTGAGRGAQAKGAYVNANDFLKRAYPEEYAAPTPGRPDAARRASDSTNIGRGDCFLPLPARIGAARVVLAPLLRQVGELNIEKPVHQPVRLTELDASRASSIASNELHDLSYAESAARRSVTVEEGRGFSVMIGDDFVVRDNAERNRRGALIGHGPKTPVRPRCGSRAGRRAHRTARASPGCRGARCPS